MRTWIDRLDAHLLSLSQEFDIDPSSLDRLQEILEGSLLFIQLQQQSGPSTTDDARDLLRARLQYIHRTHPDGPTRQRMYRLGMALSSCQTIDREQAQLLTQYIEAAQWFEWSSAQRADLLLGLSRFIFELQDTRPLRPVSAEWPALLAGWLGGMSITEMARDEAIGRFSTSPGAISVLIEDCCSYRLPWGLNSIFNYLSGLAEETGTPLPPVCSFFSGMVKYGLDDPVAVCLVPYLDQDRRLALQAASDCPHAFEHPDRVARWILHVSKDALLQSGLAPDVVERIVTKRDQQRGSVARTDARTSEQLRLLVREGKPQEVRAGQKVIVVPRDEAGMGAFAVMTLGGSSIGTFAHPDGEVPHWWRSLYLVDAEVMSASGEGESRQIVVQLVGV